MFIIKKLAASKLDNQATSFAQHSLQIAMILVLVVLVVVLFGVVFI